MALRDSLGYGLMVYDQPIYGPKAQQRLKYFQRDDGGSLGTVSLQRYVEPPGRFSYINRDRGAFDREHHHWLPQLQSKEKVRGRERETMKTC